MEARIHSTESLGTVDGPGIRFVIFMQGCPLKCKYCHNRDTWDVNGGKVINVQRLMKRILHEEPYFRSSNGGVTVSGGEPLLQAQFLIELFTELKKHNIHTCLDTAGSLPISPVIEELLSLTDLVLLDIKHIDEQKCIELTGASNNHELEFAKYLSNHNIPVWIRQVIIPGYTDDKDYLIKTKKFIDSLSNVEKVEVLPYHDLGKFKWEKLGIDYPFKDMPLPTDEQISLAKEILCP